jgi:hypothetical protein
VGKAAEVAWSFATVFVVPLIALEGLDSTSARRRSFQLAATVSVIRQVFAVSLYRVAKVSPRDFAEAS